MVTEGNIRPVIDSVYELDQVVDAHERVETGHCKGKVIIKVSD